MRIVKKVLRQAYYHIPPRLPFDFVLPCRNAVIEITYKCNLDCQMCCFLREIELKKGSIARRKELTAEQFIEVISKFPRRTNFAFTGGEPFVKRNFLEVVRACKARQCGVTIGTNGVLLDEESAKEVIDLGVEQVCFSLDGTPEMHDTIRRKQGAYESLFSNARRLRKLRESRSSVHPRIMANAVILPENHALLPEVMRLMKEMGVDMASIQAVDGSFERSASRLGASVDFGADPMPNVPRIPSEELRKSLEFTFESARKIDLPVVVAARGMTIEDLVEYYQGRFHVNNWRCTLPWSTTRISPYGDLYPCLNYSIGNVLETSPAKLWTSSRYFQFRKPFGRCDITPACAGCCKLERA
jgi:radical SAM protein with 4Fe4S-binding SPASM domain